MPEAITLAEAQAKELSRRILSCVDQADLDQAGRNDDVEEGRDLFIPRPGRTDGPWDDASDVSAPICETDLLQRQARIDAELLCVRPTLRVNGRDKGAAGNVEEFLDDFCTRTVKLREKILPAVQASLRDGSALLYITWRQEHGTQTFWETSERQEQVGESYFTQDPETGQPVQLDSAQAAEFAQYQPEALMIEPLMETVIDRFGSPQDVKVYDGPDLLLLETGYLPGDPDETTGSKARWGTYPAANADIQRSTGVWFRYTLTGDEMNARVEEGEFDADAVEFLKTTGSETEHLPTVSDDQQGLTSDDVPDDTWQWRTFDLLECYWRVPPFADDSKGETAKGKKKREDSAAADYLITIHEATGKILRAVPNPWWHGRRPFVIFRPYRPTSGVHGTSTPDLVGDFQESMQQILRDMFDMAQLRIKPPLKTKRGLLAFNDRRDIAAQYKPRGLVEVDYPESIEVMAEALGDPTAGMPVYQLMKDLKDSVSGVNDQSAGMIKGDATATEVQIARAEGDALHQHVRQNIAESIQETGWYLWHLCYQFVANESVQDSWAAADTNSEVQPGMVPGEWELHPKQGYIISAWGTTEASNRAVNRRSWEESVDRMAQLPELAVPLEILAGLPDELIQGVARRQYAMHRAFVASRELGDAEEYLGTEDDYLQLVSALVMQVRNAQAMAQQQAQEQMMMADQQAQDQQAQQQQQAQQGFEQKSALADQTHQQRMEQLQAAAMMKQLAGAAQ